MYQPPRSHNAMNIYIYQASDLILLYGILTHGQNSSTSTIRLIEAWHDDGKHYDSNSKSNSNNTIFIIHVDGKESSDDSYHTLLQHAADKEYVHIIPTGFRIRVNWGGFFNGQCNVR
jgi:hypothetical protein